MIEVKDLHKTFKQQEVLKGISFSIEKGETVSIIGPSGSGKSTLMNILGCLDLPSSGSYHLNGLDVSKLNDAQLSDCNYSA